MTCIYQIFNLITGDIYVGSAVNFQNRKYHHLYELRNNKHHSPILQNAWKKYGEDGFEFQILEEIGDKKNLIIREQFYIDTLDPKYNCSKVAGSPLGVKHTLQSRLNMSKAHKGQKPSPEAIAKRTASVLGSKRTEETKKKMSESTRKCKINQYTRDADFIKTWNSITEASIELKINRHHISSVCRGNRRTCGGYIWKYVE